MDRVDLETLRVAGITRDRRKYILNISYPSMQAMGHISRNEIRFESRHTAPTAVALYVHVPFCAAECFYCHYYKQFRRPPEEVEAFIDAIGRELEQHTATIGPLRAESLYFGGGTPSYLAPMQIDRLFRTIRSSVEFAPSAEVSFEVHPENTTADTLLALKLAGVNRLSIGVESFSDVLLRSENRRHSRADALRLFMLARDFGFESINIDLIYGLRHQSLAVWEETLDVIAELEPDSATMYYLRLKQKTPEYALFMKDASVFPSEDDLLLMHAMSMERMEAELGYTQNPVDWFISDSGHCHQYQDHNWRRGDEVALLGLGPSAYSYVDGWQYYNVNDTKKYIAATAGGASPIWRGEFLEGEERLRRTIVLGLKLGINRSWFEALYGIDPVEAFPAKWDELSRLGLVSITDAEITLDYPGKLFADETAQQFYSAAMTARMRGVTPSLLSTTWPTLNP